MPTESPLVKAPHTYSREKTETGDFGHTDPFPIHIWGIRSCQTLIY